MYHLISWNFLPGGITLHRCTPHRFYILSPTDFINISHGNRMKPGNVVKTSEGVVNNQNWRSQPMPPQQRPQMQIPPCHQKPWMNSAFAPLGPPRPIFPGSPNHKMPGFGDPQHNSILVSDVEAKLTGAANQKSKPASEFQALWNELHKPKVLHLLSEMKTFVGLT